MQLTKCFIRKCQDKNWKSLHPIVAEEISANIEGAHPSSTQTVGTCDIQDAQHLNFL